MQKPRPLDPIKDAEYMKRVYGRALFHRLRSEHNEACLRYHSSLTSKLPRTPVKMSRAVVKGFFLVFCRIITQFKVEHCQTSNVFDIFEMHHFFLGFFISFGLGCLNMAKPCKHCMIDVAIFDLKLVSVNCKYVHSDKTVCILFFTEIRICI